MKAASLQSRGLPAAGRLAEFGVLAMSVAPGLNQLYIAGYRSGLPAAALNKPVQTASNVQV
jgi:hypothetical protein